MFNQVGWIGFDRLPGVSGRVLPFLFHSRMENGQFRVSRHDCHQATEGSSLHGRGSPASVKRSHFLVECGFLPTVRDVKPQSQHAEEYTHDCDENHEVPRRQTFGPKSAKNARVPSMVHERRDGPQPSRNHTQTSREFGTRVVHKNAHPWHLEFACSGPQGLVFRPAPPSMSLLRVVPTASAQIS